MSAPRVARPQGAWSFVLGERKLAERAALPGAYGFDQASHAFRIARGRGIAAQTLLPAAMPTSWMVNNKAASTVYQRWLKAPLRERWEELLALLEGGPDAWLARTAEERARVESCAQALCVDGQGVAALSKVLASLVPETAPLLDDAALFRLGELSPPVETADAPRAGASALVPALDLFCRGALEAEAALIELAVSHQDAVLDASQVLDRLLWFDSWGYRYSHLRGGDGRRWWWVREGEREAVVPVLGPHPARGPGECVRLEALGEEPWAQRARESLAAALGA